MSARTFQLELAEEVAEDFAGWVKPVCMRLQVVGSVRRRSPRVRDVDVIAILRGKGTKPLDELLVELAWRERIHIRPREGEQHRRVIHCGSAIPIDLHLVDDIDGWWPALITRTGSAKFLRRMAKEVRARIGHELQPDGRLKLGARTKPYRSERAFFSVVRTPYVRPEERAE